MFIYAAVGLGRVKFISFSPLFDSALPNVLAGVAGNYLLFMVLLEF
jgi:hypothetical protein